MLRMRGRIAVIVTLFALTTCLLAVAGEEKMHPALRRLLANEDQQVELAPITTNHVAPPMLQMSVDPASGERYFNVLVKTTIPMYSGYIGEFPICASTGTVLSTWVTVQDLLILAEDKQVVYIEPSVRMDPKLDISLPVIGADAVHHLTPPIRGAGVIVGAVDTGIDYTHLDFRYDSDGDGSEESTRILEIWDQTIGGREGTRYSFQEIQHDLALGYDATQGTVRHYDEVGHGTHVLGIAAGDGTSSSWGLAGVAPDAWIVAVKTNFYSASILAGVGEIFEIADREGLPAVVNLSLGGHTGPHDGTSLLEQGIAELVEHPGRSVVVSAGNEGNADIHWSMPVAQETDQFSVTLSGPATEICMWYPGDLTISLTVISPGGRQLSIPAGSVSGKQEFDEGLLYVDHASEGKSVLNGDHEIYIRVTDSTPGAVWEVVVSDREGSGQVDAWVFSGGASVSPSMRSGTIAEPGNANNVITVGATVSRSMWRSLAGWQDYRPIYELGSIPDYSSEGPTRDGRVKPDLVAPGTWIAAANSSGISLRPEYLHPDGVHAFDSGTSMAAPHVSGSVALLFSLDPTLRPGQVLDLLTSTAKVDQYTGVSPSMKSGWGKLDILAAVMKTGRVDGETPHPSGPVVNITIRDPLVSTTAEFLLSYADTNARSAALKIFDLSGHLVFTANVIGQRTYIWDLSTSNESIASSGLYFFVLVTDKGASAVKRMVIQH